jgi:predicted ABC-class ATPase
MTNPIEAQAPATQGLVVQVFQMLSDKVEASHKSLRASLDSVATNMEARMTAHDKEDRAVADRVLILETNRARDIIEMAEEKARMAAEMNRRMFAISTLLALIGMVISHFWK